MRQLTWLAFGCALASSGLLEACSGRDVSRLDVARAPAPAPVVETGQLELALTAQGSSGALYRLRQAQFGGGALLLVMTLLLPRAGAPRIRWGLVIVAYAAAKAFELLDADVFALTGQVVSGHTLKHLFAALAAVPVIAALGGLGNSRQNRPRPPATMTTASPGPLGE